MSEEKKSGNPLQSLWNLLATIGGILGLSSMAEDWSSGLLKWKGFIEAIIEAYRSITLPIINFLNTVLPFDLPVWLLDYLLLGLIFLASNARAAGYAPPAPVGIMVAFFWPVWALQTYLYWLAGRGFGWDKVSTDLRYSARVVGLWFLAVLLGTVVLLAINTQL